MSENQRFSGVIERYDLLLFSKGIEKVHYPEIG